MNWMVLPYKRYAEFSGRSRRKEYWMFLLFTILVNIGLTVVQTALGLSVDSGGVGAIAAVTGVGLLSLLFWLASLIPSLAVAVRRLHDTDRSGWWLLAPIAPYVLGIVTAFAGMVGFATGGTAGAVGAGVGLSVILIGVGVLLGLVLLVFLCIEGTRGANRFGPDPKRPEGAADLQEVFR